MDIAWVEISLDEGRDWLTARAAQRIPGWLVYL